MDTHATLYVAATRGRESNEIWVATDHPPIVNGHRLQPAQDSPPDLAWLPTRRR